MKSIKDIFNGNYDNYILPLFWQVEGSEELIIEYMKKIKEVDIHAVCVESRVFEDFCGPAWWKRMKTVLKIAKELNMKVWLLDDKHFPTGYANGYIENKYPEKRIKVIKNRKIDVYGPKKNAGYYTKAINDETANLLAVVAICGDKRINITSYVDCMGTLYYDFPEGLWSVNFIYISTKTDAVQNYINMVDKESCDVLIEAVYEPHFQHFSDEFGKTFAGFFTDEPGFMNEKPNKGYSPIGKDMPLPWSNQVKELLIERLGEEFINLLPDLWTEFDERTVRIRYEYMDIVTKLYKENFSDNLGEWCRSHGCEYIGHVIEERHSNARLGCGTGNMFRSMAGKDMAGLDVIFNQLIPGMDINHQWTRGEWDGEFFHYAIGKLGSSLAQIDPKKRGRTMLEIYGAYGWHEGLKLMKWLTDHFLSRGVNHFSPHAFSTKPFPDEDCAPHFYAHGNNPQYRYIKILMQHMNRMSNIFSDGVTSPTAAILYNAESEWVGEYILPQKPAKVLVQNQVDFNFICNDVFNNPLDFKADLSNGLVVNGMKFEVLIIPYCEYISNDLANFILTSKDKELKIVCIDKAPKGLYDNEDNSILKELNNIEVIKLEELEKYILENNLYRIKSCERKEFLRYYHYFKGENEYIMLFNEDPVNDISTKIEYNTDKKLYKYDVLNNKIERMKEFNISLSPYESSVIIIGDIEEYLVSEEYPKTSKKKLLNKGYKVSIASSKEYPNFKEYCKIKEVVNFSKDEYLPGFTGTFRYETTVEFEHDIEYAEINLGDVYEVAEVFINDISVGVRICPPYRIPLVNMIKSGENKVVIEVTNTLDKEVKDQWSYTEPRQPSGLLDTVEIKF